MRVLYENRKKESIFKNILHLLHVMKGKQALQNIHNQSKNKKERLSNLAFKVNKTKK